MNPLIICGVEIELEYNPDIIGAIEKDHYHGDNPRNFNLNFYAESDSSISSTKFSDGRTAELISKPFEIKNYKKILASFQSEIYKRIAEKKKITEAEARKRYGLKDVISFNRSTGAHLHFSVLKPGDKETTISFKRCNPKFKGKFIPVKELISPAFCERFNAGLLKEICEKYPDVFPEFEAQYYRGHARSLLSRPEAFKTHYGNWSVDSEHEDIEIRGFNLNGVTNWKQFKGVYNIFLHRLYKTIKGELKRKKAFLTFENITQTGEKYPPSVSLLRAVEYIQHPTFNHLITVTESSKWGADNSIIGITEKRIYEVTINPSFKTDGRCLYCGEPLKAGELYFCERGREDCKENGLKWGRYNCGVCGIAKNNDIANCSIICWRERVIKKRTPEQIAEHRRKMETARAYYQSLEQSEDYPVLGENEGDEENV